MRLETTIVYWKHKDKIGNVTLVWKYTYIRNTKEIIKCEKNDKLTLAIIRLETYIRNIFDEKHKNYTGNKVKRLKTNFVDRNSELRLETKTVDWKLIRLETYKNVYNL